MHRSIVTVYTGSPRLIKENWESIRWQDAANFNLFTQFSLWETDQGKECADFLLAKNSSIQINLHPQPTLLELCERYHLPVTILDGAPQYAFNILMQYHGVKLGYEDANRNMPMATSSDHIFFMRSRTDLFLDNALMYAIAHQLETQRQDEVVFSGANFGSGLRDFMWLSSRSCVDLIFSVIDSICRLFNTGFFPPAEVCLKLHVDRSRIRYSINRNLPCVLIGLKNGRLYSRNSASWARRCATLQTPDYTTLRPLVPHDNAMQSLYQAVKGLPSDRRVNQELARRNQRLVKCS